MSQACKAHPRSVKHKEFIKYARTGETFILACPVDSCDSGDMKLQHLNKGYGEEPMFLKVERSKVQGPPYAVDWLPMKSRKGCLAPLIHG